MKILFIGDIMGRPGREAIGKILPEWRGKYAPDLVIANGENLAHGAGVNKKTVEEMIGAGVDVITSGNHFFDRKDVFEYVRQEKPPLIWPMNFENSDFPEGGGFMVAERRSRKIMVLNLIGTMHMKRAYQNPFLLADEFLKALNPEINIIIVDFHAETTSERKAMGLFLDGRVSAVIGTHTHIATADEQVLPKGTAYITDVGMAGVKNSVIGMEAEVIIREFKGEKVKKEIAISGEVEANAVLLDIDELTGRALKIERIRSVIA